ASRPWSRLTGPGLSTPALLAGFVVAAVVPWIVIPKPGGANERYKEMHPERWAGKSIDQLPELLEWVPLEKVPTDGKVVLWRQGCEHCAAHLSKMAEKDDGSQPLLLLQIKDDLAASRAVTLMPQGAHVTSLGTKDDLTIVVQTP